MRTGSYLLAGGLFLLACAGSAAAQEVKPIAGTGIEFMLGNDQWLPGQSYRSGDDWLALVCQKSECRFEPARLTVRKEPQQGHYDDEPTDGQKLLFKLQESGAGKVLAWFRRDANLSWLTPGPVTTYSASTAKQKRPDSEGTLELAVDLPDGNQATLVPLYDQADDKFLLQLRISGKRQLLGALGVCSHAVETGYLLWAGDLDHDGKPDYLLSFVGGTGEVRLYLGKDAADDEIVGVAGIYAPSGECDEEGC